MLSLRLRLLVERYRAFDAAVLVDRARITLDVDGGGDASRRAEVLDGHGVDALCC
jgi:hypothetical protein